MKRFLVTAVLCLSLGLPAFALQADATAPASREDVERYLQAIHYRETMLQMMDAMAKPMHQMVHEQFLKQKTNLPPDFEARMTGMMDDMTKDLPIDDMIQAMIPVFEKHFTKGEIDDLIVFYSSPTGQK